MKNYKNLILIVLIIVLVLLSGVMFWGYLKDKYGYDESICYNLPEDTFFRMIDSTIIDCIGYIRVEKDVKCSNDLTARKCGDKSIYDTNRNSFILYKVDNYKIIDDIIYAVGEIETNVITTNEGDKHIFYHPQINGEEQIVEVEAGDIIPRYVKINSQTSDAIPYKDYSEMPETDRAIFKELEKK